jgi:hypothetical protein
MFKRGSSSISERTRFTSRQIIGLVLAIGFLLLALPVGVKAAGSLVTLVDSSTTTKARVDSATSALRVGGVTNKILDKSGSGAPFTRIFTINTAPYSQIRVYAVHSGCSGFCSGLTIECVEGTARTCLIVSDQRFDETGYNAAAGIPGRTLRVTVSDSFGVGTWRVVVYGRSP